LVPVALFSSTVVAFPVLVQVLSVGVSVQAKLRRGRPIRQQRDRGQKCRAQKRRARPHQTRLDTTGAVMRGAALRVEALLLLL
jgi:hypothetical protein